MEAKFDIENMREKIYTYQETKQSSKISIQTPDLK